MGRRCLRSAIDATSEVEIRDKISDFVIGVFAKPDASIFACSGGAASVGRVMLGTS